MTPDREAAILRMLEDQLEQLRTKIKTQEEAAASETRQLQEELDAATRRATEAEARVGGASDAPPSVGPAERDMIERLRSLETELAQAKAAAAEAVAHAGELQRTVDAASPGPQAASGPADTAELVEVRARLAAAEQQVEEAQRLAAEAEQRAASNESVRGELEVRVAQLGAKAGELEQKATELETRLQEANAGGDAVRAETAALTAALAGATARVEELESVAPASGAAGLDASAAEATRLRAELASQMERAQAAEDRVARLEADVAAAEHGVRTTDEPLDEMPDDVHPAPLERVEVATPTVWVAPSAAAPQPEEETPAPQPTVQTEPEADPGTESEPGTNGGPEPMASPRSSRPRSATRTRPSLSVRATARSSTADGGSSGRRHPEREPARGAERGRPIRRCVVGAADEPDKPQEPAVQATAAMASSLDDEPARRRRRRGRHQRPTRPPRRTNPFRLRTTSGRSVHGWRTPPTIARPSTRRPTSRAGPENPRLSMAHHGGMRRPVVAAMAAVALLASVPVEAAAMGLTRSPAYHANVSTLPPAVRSLMTGSSWHAGCPVGLDDLRLIRLTYWGFDRQAHPGKLVGPSPLGRQDRACLRQDL